MHRQFGRRLPLDGLTAMAEMVASGDPQNREAQASRVYWQKLFGADFRRHAEDGVNAALNYGYAVVRACVARQLVACGLTPALGLHHDNMENPFCLADDIIEPFRPFVDDLVFNLGRGGISELTPQIKKDLAAILTIDVSVEDQTSILSNAILTCSQSLVRAFETKEPRITLPRFG
jgi:CRISPR-associated protein Cas1